MRLLKSFIVWICFIPVAILNGGLREYVLVKFIGEETALPVSGILLSVFIFLVTWLMLPRLVKGCGMKGCLAIGVCWALLTAAYNPSTGNLWVLVLATTLLSPVLLKMFKQI